MVKVEYSRAADATTLCKACGLCCTGHLFSWVRLKASELTPSENLGLRVIRNDPRQRGFAQPCHAWNGQCTIYHSPNYPKGCNSYNCKLLRELLDESVSLQDALVVVENTKDLIRTLEAQLPMSSSSSFRERFIAQVTSLKESASQERNQEFLAKAEGFLKLIRDSFGVKDFFDDDKGSDG